MTGLACNAWRDPWHVRIVRSAKRDPRGFAMNAAAWAVRAVCVIVSVFLIPLALLVMGGPA